MLTGSTAERRRADAEADDHPDDGEGGAAGRGAGPRPGQPLGLVTDLYELLMAESFWRHGMTGPATFSLFPRRLPSERSYLLAAGLAQLVEAVERFTFDDDALDWLASTERFDGAFLDWLAGLRFTGSIRALPEGTPFFADEPVVEVDGPLPVAQLLESLVMNQVHLQTTLASKAARVVDAARGIPVIDFGLRRTHGVEAAVLGARAQYIAGIDGTSNLEASRAFGVPEAGTMAHSFVQAFDDEGEALRTFAADHPEAAVLLIDTYDTLDALEVVIAESQRGSRGFPPRGIRLDSGDLGGLARACRARLDEAGLGQVKVIASGGLDEHEIDALVRAEAPIDGFGVGTGLGVSRDAPSLDLAFKLVSYRGRGRMKLSEGKRTLPGPKQVFRRTAEPSSGTVDDLLAGAAESHPGEPLLVTVMQEGRRTRPLPTLPRIRALARDARDRLPSDFRTPRGIGHRSPTLTPRLSPALVAEADRLERALRRQRRASERDPR
jgi:nicotinate phosphoribosyltransferase